MERLPTVERLRQRLLRVGVVAGVAGFWWCICVVPPAGSSAAAPTAVLVACIGAVVAVGGTRPPG